MDKEDSKVVDIRSKQPHMTGEATCPHCQHKREYVAEIGTTLLDCPSCGLEKGVPSGVCFPEQHWVCECGGCFFVIGPEAALCTKCGLAYKF